MDRVRDFLPTACLVVARDVVMCERTMNKVDRVVVQNTSGSTFWKTNRASRCKYHAPDPNPNTNRNPYPNRGDVYTSMQSTWYAVLSCITVITFLFVAMIWLSSTPYILYPE